MGENTNGFSMFILIGFFVLTTFLYPLALSHASPKLPPHPGKLKDSLADKSNKKGYCCKKGKILSAKATEAVCRVNGGTYHPSLKDAKNNCVKDAKNNSGWCFLNGSIKSMAVKQCRAKQGKFFSSKKKAEKLSNGYCCRNGSVNKTTKSQCSKKGDRYFETKREADKQCMGWCCDEFEVAERSEEQCKRMQGKYFGNETKATRYCDNLKGWCCRDGEIRRLSKSACSQKSDRFYHSIGSARASCKATQGFCNLDKQTIPMGRKMCEKKGGVWFKNRLLAKKEIFESRGRPATSPNPGIKLDGVSLKPTLPTVGAVSQTMAVEGVAPVVSRPADQVAEAPETGELVEGLALTPMLDVSKVYKRGTFRVVFTNRGGRAFLSPEYKPNGKIIIRIPPGVRKVYTMQEIMSLTTFTQKPPWDYEFDVGGESLQCSPKTLARIDFSSSLINPDYLSSLVMSRACPYGSRSLPESQPAMTQVNPLLVGLIKHNSDGQATNRQEGKQVLAHRVKQQQLMSGKEVYSGKFEVPGKTVPAQLVKPAAIPQVTVPGKSLGQQTKVWEGGGVTVTAPTTGHRYSPGDIIPVRFDYDGSFGSPRRGIIRLVNRTHSDPDCSVCGHTVLTREIGPWGTGEATVFGVGQLTVPLDIASGTYAVSVSIHDASNSLRSIAAGQGHDFEITAENIRRGIGVYRPAAGTSFRPDDELPVRFSYDSGTAPDEGTTLSILLYNESGLNYLLALAHDPENSNPTFTVPEISMTDDSFRIRIEENGSGNTEIFGISNSFTIIADAQGDEGSVEPVLPLETSAKTLKVWVNRPNENLEESGRFSAQISMFDGGTVPPLRSIRLLKDGATYYSKSWPPGEGPTTGTSGKLEWQIVPQVDLPNDFGYQVEVVASGLGGQYGLSDEFRIGPQPIVPEHRRSVGCYGNNINVTVDSGSVVLGGTIRVSWTSLASCSETSYRCSEPGSVMMFVHPFTSYGAGMAEWDAFECIPREELQVGERFSREYSLHDGFEPGEEYVISMYGADNYFGHSNPFRVYERRGEQDFRLITPFAGHRVNRDRNPRITWTVPATLDNGTGQPQATFTVKLYRDSTLIDQVHLGGCTYDHDAKTCTIPWGIGEEIPDGDGYSIKVTARPPITHGNMELGGDPVATSGNFRIGDYSGPSRRASDNMPDGEVEYSFQRCRVEVHPTKVAGSLSPSSTNVVFLQNSSLNPDQVRVRCIVASDPVVPEPDLENILNWCEYEQQLAINGGTTIAGHQVEGNLYHGRQIDRTFSLGDRTLPLELSYVINAPRDTVPEDGPTTWQACDGADLSFRVNQN